MSILLTVSSVLAATSDCNMDDTDNNKLIQRVNERYDDFFRYQRDRETRLQHIESSKENLRAKREAREKQIEQARLEFLKNRRPKPDDSKAQAQFEAELKERDRRLEVARKCLVQRKNAVDQALKKGRAVPGLTEFGLEEY